jgi:hypothetical protein
VRDEAGGLLLVAAVPLENDLGGGPLLAGALVARVVLLVVDKLGARGLVNGGGPREGSFRTGRWESSDLASAGSLRGCS